jgi:hypothetical protein
MDPTRELSFAVACIGINRGPTGLGGSHEGLACFGFRSGAVKFVSENLDTVKWLPEMLQGTREQLP